MGLVDGDEAHLHVAELLLEQVGADAFRRNVEQLHAAQHRIVEHLQNVGVCHAGIDGRRLDAAVAQMTHLVFHQGNEGRDNKGHAGKHEGGNLEGERLASACWHESQCVAATHHRVDDFPLYTTKLRILPITVQYPQCRVCRFFWCVSMVLLFHSFISPWVEYLLSAIVWSRA